MAKKSRTTKPEPTTKHVVISAVAHETLTVLADRYEKSLGEMVTILINNCFDYGLIQADEIKGSKHTVTTRIDLLEKQLKRYNDSNWSAISEMKKINNKNQEINWRAVEEAKKTTLLAAQVLDKVTALLTKE
jgi:hypothetical protein